METIGQPRVLVIASLDDFNAGSGAGPAWKVAAGLSRQYDVILAVPEVTAISHERFAVVFYNRRNIGLLVRDSDFTIMDRSVFFNHPSLSESGRLSVATRQELERCRLEAGTAGQRADIAEALGPGELLVFSPFGGTEAQRPSHYLARLRYHLRHGGVRHTAFRGGSLIKRKFGGGRKD